MDASSQGSVTKSSSKLDKETQGEDAESCSSKDHPISEETSKQSTSTSDQKEQSGRSENEKSSVCKESSSAAANDGGTESHVTAELKREDSQISSPASEVSMETKAERTLSARAEMDTYEEINKSEVASLDDWENVHKSCLSEIPPVDPEVLSDLELKAGDIARNLDHMLTALAHTLKAMSQVSMECLGVYNSCVDHVSETVDENIRSMYTLIARCEELNASLKPVQNMAEQVKEIKKTLDAFEAICK